MKKKILATIALLTVTGLALTGCSNYKEEAANWEKTIATVPGVLKVDKSVSTPLPFSANYSFRVLVEPDAANFPGLEKVLCETEPGFPKIVDVTLTDKIDAEDYGTEISRLTIESFTECEDTLPAELVAGWEALTETMPDGTLIVVKSYKETPEWEINASQSYVSTGSVARFVTNYAPNFTGYPESIIATASNTSNETTTRTTKLNLSPTNEAEMAETGILLNTIDSLTVPVQEVNVNGSSVEVIFRAGTPTFELETVQTSLNNLQLTALTSISVATDDTELASAPEGTEEFGALLTNEFYDIGYKIVPGSSGVAVFVPTVDEALTVTKFVEANNTDKVPFRINIEKEPVYFSGYYAVNSTINELDPYLLDYKKLAPVQDFVNDVKFNADLGNVSLEPRLMKNSTEYNQVLEIVENFDADYTQLNIYANGEVTRLR